MNHLENHSSIRPIAKQESDPTTRDLRYVLTQKCNYRCGFCHKEWCDGSEKNLLYADDYNFIFSTARAYVGIDQVTLSGGEPMMRKDIVKISQGLHDAGAKVTMVSNGARIDKHPEIMQYIDVLNISLHTTNQDLYTILTWSSTKVKDLIEWIIHIHDHYPHLQIKLNSAIINQENTPDTDDFAYKVALASRYWWKLKYLELSDEHIPGFVCLDSFQENLLKHGFLLGKKLSRQTTYKKDNVEVITWKVFCSEAKQTQDPQGYCKQYNDIYITPDGYISSCPIDIKKITAYDTIVSRNWAALGQLFQEAIDNNTQYQCPFSK